MIIVSALSLSHRDKEREREKREIEIELDNIVAGFALLMTWFIAMFIQDVPLIALK